MNVYRHAFILICASMYMNKLYLIGVIFGGRLEVERERESYIHVCM